MQSLVFANLMQSVRGSVHSPHSTRNIIMKEWGKFMKFHLQVQLLQMNIILVFK